MTTGGLLVDAKAENALGQEVESDEFFMPEKGAPVEVDDSYHHETLSRVRFPAEQDGVFHVGQVHTTSVKDLRAEYAARRITEIDETEDAGNLPAIAAGWVERAVRIWWTEQPPRGLSVEQHVTVVDVAESSFTVHPDIGENVIVPFAGFDMDHISFERPAAEIAEREQKLESRESIPVMTPQEALAWLARVDLLKPLITKPPTISITVSDTGEAFEQACVVYLGQTVQFRGKAELALEYAQLVNAFADKLGDTAPILLRPGAQGTGTEVHETLHALSPDTFGRQASFFLREGVTEYFTRMAVTDKFDREPFYDSEHFFVDRLVKVGATTPEILAQLYFAGNWAGFEQGLYQRAGDLISIKVFLDRVANGKSYAVIDYLDELIETPEAPLAK
jgi:hypothetical protein